MTIASLQPGTTFTRNGQRGILLYVTPSGATVQWLAQPKTVHIPEQFIRGKVIPARAFTAKPKSKPTTVSAGMEVEA